MAADQLLLRSQTFLARKAWKKEYADGLRDNTLRLGRNRFTSGETVLAQADSERGALHARPDGALWFARLDGTGVSDDETREGLFAPYRAIWHYDDRNGAPETDGRSIKGDLIIWDDGTNDRFLGVCTGSGVYGLGVRAEYRTAATGTNSTTKRQPSDRVMMRGSSWDGAAAVTRDWSLRTVIDNAADGGDDWGIYFECRAGAGSWSSPFSFGRQGSFSFSGNSPCVTMNFTSGGSRALIFGSAATQADGQEFVFCHNDATKWSRFRFQGTTTGDTGTAAEVLGVSYRTAADGSTTKRNSPSIVLRGSYHDGTAHDACFYAQHVLDTTAPAGRLRIASDYGLGSHEFHYDGTFGTSGAILLGATAPAALRFDAAPGTHTALDAGTGGADAWIVVDKNGSDAYAYVPVLDTKDLGILTPVYGELSLTDGSASSSITDGPNEWNPLAGFDAAGEAAGCVPDTGVGAITPVAGAIFEVSLSVSFSGDAASEYVFAIAELLPPEGEGPPTFVQFSRQARVETIDTEKHAVSVTCLLDVSTGSALAPVVKSPTGATVGITLLEGSFTLVKVAESTPS